MREVRLLQTRLLSLGRVDRKRRPRNNRACKASSARLLLGLRRLLVLDNSAFDWFVPLGLPDKLGDPDSLLHEGRQVLHFVVGLHIDCDHLCLPSGVLQ